jgi:hypothetical protein
MIDALVLSIDIAFDDAGWGQRFLGAFRRQEYPLSSDRYADGAKNGRLLGPAAPARKHHGVRPPPKRFKKSKKEIIIPRPPDPNYLDFGLPVLRGALKNPPSAGRAG